MSTIAQQLVDLNNIKIDLRLSIIGKGISVDASDAFNTYPDKIDSITGGATNPETFNIGVGFNAQVDALIIDSSNKVYVSGSFTTYKGVSQNRLIRLNSDGSKDTTFDIGTGFDGEVKTILLDSSNKLYVGGMFDNYKGVVQKGLIKINPDGSKDTTFDISSGFNTYYDRVSTLLLDSSNRLYVGGGYTTYQGLSQKSLVRLNSDGSKDTAFDISTGFDNIIKDIIIDSSSSIYIGGSFTTYRGLVQKGFLKLNQDGTKDTIFDASTSFPLYGYPYSFALDSSNKLYIGGSFSTYKGVSQNYLIRINSDGSKDTTFDIGTGFNGIADALVIDSSNKLYVGGSNFTTYKGVIANYLIKLNSDGSKDTTFDPSFGFNNLVSALSLDSSNRLYVGGNFTTFDQHYYLGKIARILPNAVSDTISI